jgi:hypothetical protein
MGVNHGGTNPPRIGSGGTLIQVVPPHFCYVSKFQAIAMDSSPQISIQIYAIGWSYKIALSGNAFIKFLGGKINLRINWTPVGLASIFFGL